MASSDHAGEEFNRSDVQGEVRRAIEVVESMKRGEIKREGVPWGNHMLQEAVLRMLREMPNLERAAQHLAIVKSVFSGGRS